MKKIIFVFVLLVSILIFTSCDNTNENPHIDNTTTQSTAPPDAQTDDGSEDSRSDTSSHPTVPPDAQTDDSSEDSRSDTSSHPTVPSDEQTDDGSEDSHSDSFVQPPEKVYIDYMKSGGSFELPLDGASGYASINLNLHQAASTESEVLGLLQEGEVFRIIQESGDWWQIETEALTGWIEHKFCFINLPDIIPSIVYSCSNASSSKFISSGKEIGGITGEKLYDAYTYNERLNKEEYIMPVLYPMAAKICAAQQAVLAEGNTLILYEGFRPYDVQQKVVYSLKNLADNDPAVKEGITTSPWSISWFIAEGVSNHQKGYAIDVSFGKVITSEERFTGEYSYSEVISYEEYEMQTPIHELSYASAAFQYPVSSMSDTAWRTVPVSETMNESALLLQNYCTNAGLTPLASEWWHFNDLEAAEIAYQTNNIGKYFLSTVMSKAPYNG